MGEGQGEQTKQLRWSGLSFLTTSNATDTRDTANQVEMTADADGVQYKASGIGNGKQVEVESRSTQVKAWLERIDEAHRKASEIIPFTKAMQVGKGKSRDRRDPNELVNCPVCKGDARWTDCLLCDDRRTVTLQTARQYLDLS